ncbi:MAG: type IV pilus modification PilV family protein [Thermodesulfobacteriota bacterium]
MAVNTPSPGHRDTVGGFTLVEVLIAVAIFSIGVLGAAAMQTRAIATNNTFRRTALATECAADITERLLLLNFNHPDLGTGGTHTPGDIVDNDGDGADDLPINPEYNAAFDSITWTVTDSDLGLPPIPAPYAGIPNPPIVAKHIIITVTWYDGAKSLSLETIKTLGVSST